MNDRPGPAWSGPTVRRVTMSMPTRWVWGGLIATLLICGMPQLRAQDARPNSPPERFEVASLKAVRPYLVSTLEALQRGNITQAQQAFEGYDAGWNGIEVYINVRSRDLYRALELDLQVKI